MVGIYDNEMKLEFVSKSSNEAFATYNSGCVCITT